MANQPDRHQRAIDAAEKARQRVPETLLEDNQAAFHLVDRGQPLMTHFIRLPRRQDLPPECGLHLGPLWNGEVCSIAFSQQLGDSVVLVDQRPPRDLGRVGGEHELDLQRADSLVQRCRRDVVLCQPRKHFIRRAALRR